MVEITCCLCSKISTSVDQLESHLALKHFNSTPYQCEVCLNNDQLSSFPTEASIRDHIAREHGAPKFWYRVWWSAEIDRERAEIRKCIDKSVKTSMLCTQSPTAPAATSCESPFLSLTDTTPTNDANAHFRAILEHNNEPDSNIKINSSRSSGLASEEHLPAMIEDTPANIADLIDTLKTEPDLPLTQVKREPKSFVSEQEDMNTFDENLDESEDRRTSGPASSTPKSSNLIDCLFNGSPTANQSGAVKKSAKKIPAKKKKAAKESLPDKTMCHRSPTADQLRAVKKSATERVAKKKKAAKKSLPDQSMQTVQNTQSEGRRISREPVRKRRISDLKSVKCSECAAIVLNHVSSIKRHINARHVKLPMHTCKVCDKVFYGGEIHVALEHVRKAHKGDLELVLDQKAENWAALNDHLGKYFPDASVKKEQNETDK